MISNLYTGQPGWLILFCLFIAAAYSIVLYFRERKNEFSVILRVFLGIIRFLAVFIISFMLLSPFFRSITKVKEKPVIILALDNSQSVGLVADSAVYRGPFLDKMDDLAAELGKIAEPRRYLFGEELRLIPQDFSFRQQANYNDLLTDFSGMFSELAAVYDNRNVGAVIIASDGIFNAGANPVYQMKGLPYPVLTIALGDTSTRRDLMILKVNYNRLVYLDNQFPVEVVVHAHASEGARSRLTIYQDGIKAAEQDVAVDRDDFTRAYQFVLNARESGLNKVTVTLDPVEGEVSEANNRKDIFIEVLDSRNKVLILSSAPHPDISALRQAITSNQNYEVEEYLYKDFRGNPEEYNLVILHQLPSVNEPAAQLLAGLSEKKVPVLFILGAKSDLVRFNQAKPGMNLITGRLVTEEAIPLLNPDFNAFSLSPEIRNWLIGLPPLYSPLGEYQVANSAKVMMFQRLGSVQTSRPLILFNETLDGRSGVIAGEGIWKWRLYDFARNENHQAFDEMVNKMVQFLSLKEQKKKFRIYHRSNFQENQPVEFDAELYNENYELVNEFDIGMTIQDEEGRQFPFVFNKSGNAYQLNAGTYPPGNYSFVAKVAETGQYPSEGGQFSVSALDLESLNTIADHNLLFQLSSENQGKMYGPGQLDQLAEDLLQREEIKPVTYTRKSYEDLINKWWVVAVILGLLALEWFLRKRAGGY